MRLRCWTLVDRAVVSRLGDVGWRIESTRPTVFQGVVIVLRGQKGRWDVFAPDTARLHDICLELDKAGSRMLRQHYRYLAAPPQRAWPRSSFS